MRHRDPPAVRPPTLSRSDDFSQSFQTPALQAPDQRLDRRGEALLIFTTIFVRPALDLRRPVRRIAGTCVLAARHLATGVSGTTRRIASGRARRH